MSESKKKVPAVMYFFIKNEAVTQRQSVLEHWLKLKKEVFVRYADTEGEVKTYEYPIKYVIETMIRSAYMIKFKDDNVITFSRPDVKLKVVSPSYTEFINEETGEIIYNMFRAKKELESGCKMRCIYREDPNVKTTTAPLVRFELSDNLEERENRFFTETGCQYLYV